MLTHLKRGGLHFVLSTFLMLWFAASADAQISSIPDSQSQTGFGGINSIVGTVFGSSGLPVETRVRIRLSSMTAGDRTTTTNETGNFAFRGLPAGSFTISIDREKDFKPVSQSVDIIQFRGSPAQTYTLNLRLEYKDQERAEPSVVDAQFAGVPQTALGHYNEAIKQAQKGEHTAAVLTLEMAVKEHPTFTMAYNELGVQYLRLKKVNEADEAFQKALKIDSAAFPPNLNRGMILFFQKRYSEAQPILQKAVEIKPDSVAGHYFYGQTLANLGLFEDAERELLIATKVANPEMKEAHRTLAIIYNSRGDKKRGIAQLEAYLKAAPDTADAGQLKALLKKLKGSN